MKNKILIIGPIPPPYHGVSIVTKIILNSDFKKMFNILHLDTSDRRNLNNLDRIDFINVWLTFKHILRLTKIIFKQRPAVVYLPMCQTVKGLLRDAIFILIVKLGNAKVVIHLHGSYFRKLYDKSNLLSKFLIRYMCNCMCRAIVLGENLRYIFEGLISSKRITVIPNGIGNPFPNNFDKNIYREDTYYKVLYLSTLMESKGYIDVICAMPEVLRFNNATQFIFAGEFYDGNTKKKYILEFIRDNNLAANFVLKGTVINSEKKNLLLSSDIFILPSYNEGQPLAILEAMVAGLPIIATDVGAVKEMVIDGENGFIVEKNSPKQIAEKIIFLLKNENLRREMGKKSRERFLKYYTKDKFIERLTKVFEEVLSE